MRRVLLWSLVAAGMLAATPARAATDEGLIATPSSLYLPENPRLPAGWALNFWNLDNDAAHSVTSDAWLDEELDIRLFDSTPANFREMKAVQRVRGLARSTYGFHCSVHPAMRGQLTIF